MSESEWESPLEAAWAEFGGDPIPPSHGWVKVKCVLHPDSRPSAQVHLEHGKWRCFSGCGFGDVYDLIGIHESIPEFLDQKRFAQDKGWLVEEEPPEPSLMNPRPRTNKRGPKKRWKPAWL